LIQFWVTSSEIDTSFEQTYEVKEFVDLFPL